MTAKLHDETDPDEAADLRDLKQARRAERDKLASGIANLDASIGRDGTASIDDLTRWAGLLDDLPALWDRLDVAQQRELLQILFGSGGLTADAAGKLRTSVTSTLAWSYRPFVPLEEWEVGPPGFEPGTSRL